MPRNNGQRHAPEGVLSWTGALIKLVELIYGMQEMGCIGSGDLPINEITTAFSRFFGLENAFLCAKE